MPAVRPSSPASSIPALILASILALAMGPVATPAAARAAGADPALLAAGIRGDIWVLRAGGGLVPLLRGAGALGPRLSPDGRAVAYVAGDPGTETLADRPGAVLVVRADGPPGARARPLPGGRTDSYFAGLSFSPDSSRLAYARGQSLVLAALGGGRPDVVLRPPPAPWGAPYVPYGAPPGTPFVLSGAPAAWSPDGRHVAALAAFPTLPASPFRGQVPLQVVLVWPAVGGPARVAGVRFPPGALGQGPGRVPASLPGGTDLAWSADGRFLLLGTASTLPGRFSLAGLWRVGAGGGTARPVPGRFRGATHVRPSPGSALLAADPGRGLRVYPAAGGPGRALATMPPGCVVGTFVWLRDGSGLAYTRLCPVPGPGYLARAELLVAPLAGPSRGPLDTEIALDPAAALDIGPAARCVQCGP